MVATTRAESLVVMPKKPAAAAATESGPDFELSEHLPYLFRHIHAQLEAASAGKLASSGINVAVWRILAVLWQHGDLSHRALSDLTSIEVSTLSRVSKSVQRDGLIRRKRTQADQRTVRVTLTDKGRDLVKQLIPAARQMQSEIVGALSAEEVGTLTRLLHAVVGNLGAYGESDFEVAEQATPAAAAKPKPPTRAANGAAKRVRKAAPRRDA